MNTLLSNKKPTLGGLLNNYYFINKFAASSDKNSEEKKQLKAFLENNLTIKKNKNQNKFLTTRISQHFSIDSNKEIKPRQKSSRTINNVNIRFIINNPYLKLLYPSDSKEKYESNDRRVLSRIKLKNNNNKKDYKFKNILFQSAEDYFPKGFSTSIFRSTDYYKNRFKIHSKQLKNAINFSRKLTNKKLKTEGNDKGTISNTTVLKFLRSRKIDKFANQILDLDKKSIENNNYYETNANEEKKESIINTITYTNSNTNTISESNMEKTKIKRAYSHYKSRARTEYLKTNNDIKSLELSHKPQKRINSSLNYPKKAIKKNNFVNRVSSFKRNFNFQSKKNNWTFDIYLKNSAGLLYHNLKNQFPLYPNFTIETF